MAKKTYSPYKIRVETFNRFRGVANYDNQLTLPKEYVGQSDNIDSFRVAEINQRVGQSDEEFDSEGPIHTGAAMKTLYMLADGPNVYVDDLDSRLIKTTDIDFIRPISPWPSNVGAPTEEEIKTEFTDKKVTCSDIWAYDREDGVIGRIRNENKALVIYNGESFVGDIGSCYDQTREPILCHDLWGQYQNTEFTERTENGNLVIVDENGVFVNQPYLCWEYIWDGQTPVYQEQEEKHSCYLTDGSVSSQILTFERPLGDIAPVSGQSVTVSLTGSFNLSNVKATIIDGPFEIQTIESRTGRYSSTSFGVNIKPTDPGQSAAGLVTGKAKIYFTVCGKELCIPVDLELITYLEKKNAWILFGIENETGGECTRCQYAVGDWNGGSASLFIDRWTDWPVTGNWVTKHSGYTHVARTSNCSFGSQKVNGGWFNGKKMVSGNLVYGPRTNVIACNCPQTLYVTWATHYLSIYRTG